jgi:phosphoribosylanthranilate isomerase
MLLKATAVTNLTDARYFAAKDVAYLGFNLEEGTEGYLDPMYMKAIREWVTGPRIVGEFSRQPLAHVAAAASFFELDTVQLSAENHLAELPSLAQLDVILHVDGRLDMTSIQKIFHNAQPFVSCFLIDFSLVNNWESAMYLHKDAWNVLFDLQPTLLQANVTPGQLAPLFQQLRLAGLSIVGGEEERVGVKSFDQIEELLESLEG